MSDQTEIGEQIAKLRTLGLTDRRVLSLAESLAPGGLLVVGVGEVAGWQHPQLVPVADERVLAFTRKG